MLPPPPECARTGCPGAHPAGRPPAGISPTPPPTAAQSRCPTAVLTRTQKPQGLACPPTAQGATPKPPHPTNPLNLATPRPRPAFASSNTSPPPSPGPRPSEIKVWLPWAGTSPARLSLTSSEAGPCQRPHRPGSHHETRCHVARRPPTLPILCRRRGPAHQHEHVLQHSPSAGEIWAGPRSRSPWTHPNLAVRSMGQTLR